MLGRDKTYDRVPCFYSDQYDMGMEYSGYVEKGDYDEVAFRGELARGEYIAFWLRDGRVRPDNSCRGPRREPRRNKWAPCAARCRCAARPLFP